MGQVVVRLVHLLLTEVLGFLSVLGSGIALMRSRVRICIASYEVSPDEISPASAARTMPKSVLTTPHVLPRGGIEVPELHDGGPAPRVRSLKLRIDAEVHRSWR